MLYFMMHSYLTYLLAQVSFSSQPQYFHAGFQGSNQKRRRRLATVEEEETVRRDAVANRSIYANWCFWTHVGRGQTVRLTQQCTSAGPNALVRLLIFWPVSRPRVLLNNDVHFLFCVDLGPCISFV